MGANPNFKVKPEKQKFANIMRPLLLLAPRKWYVSWQYRYITGRKINWKTLDRYTEKLQHLRLNYFPYSQDVINATSRIRARTRVAKQGLEHLLIPLVGIYHDVDAIDFNALPNKFVIKGVHACAFNYICADKDQLNVPKLKYQLRKWLSTDYGKQTIEPHYSKIKPGFIIEEYLGDEAHLPLEYKIHVFNGVARYYYVVSDRGKDIHYDNFYADGTPFPRAQFNDWQSSGKPERNPSLLPELIKYAEKLAEGLLYCRVDLFVLSNKVYFNEFTFTPAKGTLRFADDAVDFEISQWLDISSTMKKKET